MIYTYKITVLGAGLDVANCPPAVVFALFPAFAGETVTINQGECLVTFPTKQSPVDLGPTIVVEETETT
jgi:hypothetical protein